MGTSTVVVVLIVLASLLWVAFFGGRLPKPFHDRNCQGKKWHQAFPSASKDEIREFLSLFVGAFAFSNKEKLKFNPDDKILQVYRAIYPSRLTPDALELETLALEIEKKYKLRLEGIWHEKLTLGELFLNTRRGHNA